MKKTLVWSALIWFLAISPGHSLASYAVINLLGTWTTASGADSGNASAYTPGGPVTDIRITMKITDQQGDLFTGNITFAPPYGNDNPDIFTGVLEGNKLYLTSSMIILEGERFLDLTTHKINFRWHAMNAEGMSGGPDTGKGIFKRTSTKF
jgi:hypothetical protein